MLYWVYQSSFFWEHLRSWVMQLLVDGPVVAWNVFFVQRRLEELEIFRCIIVLDLRLKCLSDINEGSWIHFSFPSLCWWFWLHGYFKWVFSSVGQVLDWSLFVLHFYWSVCTLAPKLIWPRRDWLCSLLLKFASFCCLQICVD